MTLTHAAQRSTALVPLGSLIAFLERAPVRNLFPLYICAARPEAEGLAVLENGAVVGCLVAGHPFGLFAARSGWLIAASPEAQALLMARGGPSLWQVGIQCERALAQTWQPRESGLEVSLDLLLARAPSSEHAARTISGTATFPQSPERDEQVLQLDCRNLTRLPPVKELRSLLGPPSDFPVESPLFGLWREGQIVAVAETLVRYGTCLSIQQVYTLPAFRKSGASRTLLSAIVDAASRDGMTCTYLVDSTNEASVRLALSLGFEVVWELACIGRG